MSEATARAMVGIMRGVTETGGTAKQAAIDGYPVAGKTGTAQKVVGGHYDPDRYVASFVGFAPAQDPRIALIVLMDEPQGGHLGRRGRGAGLQGDRRAGAALPARAPGRNAGRHVDAGRAGRAKVGGRRSADDDDVPAGDLPPTDAPVAYAGEPDEAPAAGAVASTAGDDSEARVGRGRRDRGGAGRRRRGVEGRRCPTSPA